MSQQQTDSFKKRFFEIDLLKVLAIICMFGGHIGETIFSKEWEGFEYCLLSPFTKQIMMIMIIIVPFSFMFAMGCTMLSSRNKSPQKWIKRGIILLLCWLLVNLLRSFSLYSLFLSDTYPFSTQVFLYLLSVTDILLFAGLFFLFCGLLSACRVSENIIIIVGILINIVGSLIPKFPTIEGLPTFLDNFAGGFVHIPQVSSFSFCNWVIIPILGMIWGKFLCSKFSRNKLYNISFFVGILGCLICFKFLWLHIYISSGLMYDNVQTAYAMSPLTVLTGLFIVLLLLAVFYKFEKSLTSFWIKERIINLAKNLPIFYIIHWGIVAILMLIVPRPTHQYPIYVCFFLAIFLIPFCNNCANFINMHINKSQ